MLSDKAAHLGQTIPAQVSPLKLDNLDRNPLGLRAIVGLYVLAGCLMLIACLFATPFGAACLAVLALFSFGLSYGLSNRINWIRVAFIVLLAASIPAGIGLAAFGIYREADPKHLRRLSTLPLTIVMLWYLLRPSIRRLFRGPP